MNQFILTSVCVGKDPTINNDRTFAVFNVAETRKYKDSKTGDWTSKTNWFTISCFGLSVKTVESYVKKGMKLNIIGNISPNEYTNKDGQKIKNVNLVATHIEFCESRAKTAEKEEKRNEGFMSIPEGVDAEGLPFN